MCVFAATTKLKKLIDAHLGTLVSAYCCHIKSETFIPPKLRWKCLGHWNALVSITFCT